MPARIRAAIWSLALAALALVAFAPPASARRPRPSRLRALTFNIRFDFPNDGQNRWEHRAEIVAKTILAAEAPLVCLQEDKEHQVDDLKRLMPAYEFVGRGRNAAGTGERCSIAFDPAVLALREQGSFWLSDTPDVPGSNTFEDKYPRVTTWAIFQTRGGSVILVLNTHLVEGDHRDEIRVKGAQVIRNWLAGKLGLEDPRTRRQAAKVCVIVAGDFNSRPDTQAHDILVEDPVLGLRDAWEEAPGPGLPGTVHGFEGRETKSRIDWLLVGGPVHVEATRKLEDPIDGRLPSDHYPVLAELIVR